jgi:hypothetical protein
MLGKLQSRLTYANVMATLGVFIALGGTAYAVNTVGSADIIDGEVKSVDIGNNEIGSNDVKDNSINTFDVHSFLGVDVVDGSLTAKDVGKGTFVDFDAAIGTVAANSCANFSITGVNAQGDHLLLTPSAADADNPLEYTAMYVSLNGNVGLRVCNPTAVAVDDGFTHFNLLVFEAQ